MLDCGSATVRAGTDGSARRRHIIGGRRLKIRKCRPNGNVPANLRRGICIKRVKEDRRSLPEPRADHAYLSEQIIKKPGLKQTAIETPEK
jgi:hypothetical protein